ncbi:MAG: hypothetical protein IKI29_03185 [Clostridia bacterium]|nr:hypothetical protein [Clostridia bacterium]
MTKHMEKATMEIIRLTDDIITTSGGGLGGLVNGGENNESGWNTGIGGLSDIFGNS